MTDRALQLATIDRWLQSNSNYLRACAHQMINGSPFEETLVKMVELLDAQRIQLIEEQCRLLETAAPTYIKVNP